MRTATLMLAAGVLAAAACSGRNDFSDAEAAELSAREQRLGEKLASTSSDTTFGEPLARWIRPSNRGERRRRWMAEPGVPDVTAHSGNVCTGCATAA